MEVSFYRSACPSGPLFSIDILLNDVVIYIKDSYRVKTKLEMQQILEFLYDTYPNTSLIEKRGIDNLIAEWRVHNLCYALHFFRSKTASVNLEYPQSKWLTALYNAISFVYFW